jgi:hypothetical protein
VLAAQLAEAGDLIFTGRVGAHVSGHGEVAADVAVAERGFFPRLG